MALKFAANLSMMFTEMDIMDRFSAAAAAGFRTVELWFPYELDLGEVQKRLLSENLDLVLFNLPAGDFGAGERGLACDPDRQHEFRTAVDLALEIAKILGVTRLHAMIGLEKEGLSREEQLVCVVENFKWAAPVALEAGVTLLIEALNPYDNPGFLVTTSRQGIELVQQIDEPNVKFQFDFYHLQITEGNLTRNFRENLEHIGHIQIADVPGRHQPGTGEINYTHILNTIKRSDYSGFVGLEYAPLGAIEEALAWMQPWL